MPPATPTDTVPPPEPRSSPKALFRVSALALFAAGMSFSLRASVAGGMESEHFVGLDSAHSGLLTAQVLGISFLGFAVTLFFASSFLGVIGMGRGLLLCGVCFALGTVIVCSGDRFTEGQSTFRLYWVGYLLCGMGWGFMEATVNPLTAAAYPDEKTHRLNVVHAWWPAGIIAGGCGALAMQAIEASWEAQFGLTLLPSLGIVYLALSLNFPRTERESMGISMGEMIREILRRPMFVLWWLCMLLTAAAELAPGQWIDLALSRTVGMRGIVLLIYVSAMMFVLRHFAGPIARRITPIGILWGSTVLAGIGLIALGRATTPVEGLLAATIWGLGVCFLWPTMLSNISERYPQGGEFFVGLMGVAGAASIYFVLPEVGQIFDRVKVEIAGGGEAFAGLSGAGLEAVLAEASAQSFESLAWAPAILFIVFGAIWWTDRRPNTTPRESQLPAETS